MSDERVGASILTKVLTGVVTTLLISGILFGMSVYGFVAKGPYVQEDVYLLQQRYIMIELEELNGKMDAILQQEAERGT
jgi:hypothetical protein